MRSNWSAAASHVDRATLLPHPCSIFCSFCHSRHSRPEGCLLVRSFFERRVERNISLDHHPLFQSVSSFVRIIERVLSNIVAVRPLSRCELRVEISGNVCSAFGCSFNVIPRTCTSCISRVWDVNTGQHDLTLLVRQHRDGHSFTDTFCIDDLPFPSLVQQNPDSVFAVEASGTHVSHSRIASHLRPSISLRSSLNLSLLCNDLTFF